MSIKSMTSSAIFPKEFKPQLITERQITSREDERETVDTTTGEIYMMRKIPHNRMVKHDGAIYTKLFRGNITNFTELSIPAYKLFLYICNILRPNSCEVYIDSEDFLIQCGYTKTSKRVFYQAIEELAIHNTIIKKANTDKSYWINTNILFNGDRTKL